MKSYNELSRLGRLRRMRGLAVSALERYGLSSARLVLARHSGNTLYRVYSDERGDDHRADGLFESGQYLLRVHWTGYRDEAAVQLELEWLSAMREECDLPVPEPIRTLDGALHVRIASPDIPDPKCCSILRWVRGRRIGGRAVAKHYSAQGQLMAKMHNFSEAWSMPGPARPREYNHSGLLRDIPALCLPIDDIWSLLPAEYRGPFTSVSEQVRDAMETLGVGASVYGLIHADLGVDANLLFWHGHPRAIDFDEFGLGYWVYDLAVALEHCREQEDFARNRDALLDSYCGVRTLTRDQLLYLDLFMAALDVHIGLWTNAVACLRPERRSVRRRAERCLRLVEIYLNGGDSHGLEPPN
jgi:Ser/Thr protein kinase RdoA (MazF antagonist)